MVAFLLWVQAVGGSNPPSPTNFTDDSRIVTVDHREDAFVGAQVSLDVRNRAPSPSSPDVASRGELRLVDGIRPDVSTPDTGGGPPECRRAELPRLATTHTRCQVTDRDGW